MSTTEKIETSSITLVYGENVANSYTQNLADFPEVGGLIDEHSGDDLDLLAVEVTDESGDVATVSIEHFNAVLVWTNESGEEFDQPIGEIVEAGTAIDPYSGEDLELSHVLAVVYDA